MMKELGIGIIDSLATLPDMEKYCNLYNCIEVEPQTLWLENFNSTQSRYKIRPNSTEEILSLNKSIVFHGVGNPVGGTEKIDDYYIKTLKEHINLLKPEWISEHLAFNSFELKGKFVPTNFFLPPFLTEEGIKTSIDNIKNYKSVSELPFAFETAVNYFDAFTWEMKESTFFTKVAEESDSFILLDIHNILCNERNGRQSIEEFINNIPLERVLEVHLANGYNYKGKYLDAHSGTTTDDVNYIASKIIARLPNLKLIVFEMMPEYLSKTSSSQILKQFEDLNRLWDIRGKKTSKHKNKIKEQSSLNPLEVPSQREWEVILGNLALGKKENNSFLANQLTKDKGLEVVKDIVFEFRASSITSILNKTMKYLILSKGKKDLVNILNRYFSSTKPNVFPLVTSLNFIDFLISNEVDNDIFKSLLDFEKHTLLSAMNMKTEPLVFHFDFSQWIAELEKGILSEPIPINKPFTLDLSSLNNKQNTIQYSIECTYHE